MRAFAAAVLPLFTTSVLALAPATRAQESQGASTAPARAFELRIYTAEKGKLDALERRFREHTISLFEKHGMQVVGFWKPIPDEGEPDQLVYLLAYPSQEARNRSWTAFGQDPEWQRVSAESQKDGTLVKKVESTRLDPTDYSPLK